MATKTSINNHIRGLYYLAPVKYSIDNISNANQYKLNDGDRFISTDLFYYGLIEVQNGKYHLININNGDAMFNYEDNRLYVYINNNFTKIEMTEIIYTRRELLRLNRIKKLEKIF
jgi:hypothetical protein